MDVLDTAVKAGEQIRERETGYEFVVDSVGDAVAYYGKTGTGSVLVGEFGTRFERVAKVLYKVERSDISAYQEVLLKFLMSPKARFLVRQKDIIKALVPLIKAAKDMGAEWSDIAEILQTTGKGLRLKAETIKEYYLDELRLQKDESIEDRAERYKQAAELAMTKFRESSGQSIESYVEKAIADAAAKGHAEVKAAVTAPVATTGAAPSPAKGETSNANKADTVTGNPGAARAASPPASQLREPSVGQVAAVGDRDWEKIMENVIDVTKIPKRPD